MNFPLRIALRYLFAGRRSRGISGRISAVSIAGMAIGTAALVVILSVYNGFERLIRENELRATPDYVVRPSAGKHFVPDAGMLDRLREREDVLTADPILREMVYACKDGRYFAVEAAGRPDVLGVFASGEVGRGPVELLYPDAKAGFSPSNPAVSRLTLEPSGVFHSDGASVLMPDKQLSAFLGLPEGSVSQLEIRGGISSETLGDIVGEGLDVLGREEQNPTLYRMLRFEKLVIFLILFFVLTIVAFNIGACLTMLRIEKQDDMHTLEALGLDRRSQKSIFVLEGWLVSLGGMLIGLACGLLTVWAQGATGLVRMPGLMGQPYPVELQFRDILLTALGVVVIGAFVSINCVSLHRENSKNKL